MKAFVLERTGDPNDVLAVRELPKPKPGPGETLVRVRLSPVHPSDMHIMRGRFGRQPTLPASPGIECVGVVEALGSGVAGPAPGTRVVLLNVCGSWRELIVSPAERVIPVPGDLPDEDAAQALVNPVTAWVMTMVEHDLKPGDWLVQTAAGSTVGQPPGGAGHSRDGLVQVLPRLRTAAGSMHDAPVEQVAQGDQPVALRVERLEVAQEVLSHSQVDFQASAGALTPLSRSPGSF